MSTFAKPPKHGGQTFGRNEFLRSVDPKPQTESYTVAHDSVPLRLIEDGVSAPSHQRVLQPGTAMAKITSGKNAGKIGPFQAAGTSEVQTITKSGTWVGATGSYALVIDETDESISVPVAATSLQVQGLLRTLPSMSDLLPIVTGGPLGSAPLVIVFSGGDNARDVPSIRFDGAGLTGGTAPSASVVETTKGTAGANDGRAELDNIVGIELTFLPWTLLKRDVEVSVVTDATCVQAWCKELDGDGNEIPLTNTTADAMRGKKRLDIKFS